MALEVAPFAFVSERMLWNYVPKSSTKRVLGIPIDLRVEIRYTPPDRSCAIGFIGILP
jgi:hypothetical protein